MKTLQQFIKESCEWVGCMWNNSSAIALQGNKYANFTIENIKEYMNSLTTDYKWNTQLSQFVNVENDLSSEEDIDNYIDNQFKTNWNYRKYNYEDFASMVKEIYDQYVNDYSLDGNHVKTKGHSFVKNDAGEILSLKEWLKKPCDYYQWNTDNETWEEHLKKDWEHIQNDKQETIEYLTRYAKGYLTNTVNKTITDLRNIKLDKDIEFGSVTGGAGRQTREEHGYLTIGEGTQEGKTLILSYTTDESEALELKTLGDLLDLLYQYKKVKLETPAGVLNTRWASSIILYPLDNQLKQARVGVIKFR